MSENGSWWKVVNAAQLAQGDLLVNCLAPIFSTDDAVLNSGEIVDVSTATARLIVVTQTCDLENKKAHFVALCAIHTLTEFEVVNPDYKRRSSWENVRKGRVEGLHLLASPENPNDNGSALVVDFGHIISLPFAYLEKHAAKLGERRRLESPYLEHFSQAFARFFMRVGIPSTIPSYNNRIPQ